VNTTDSFEDCWVPFFKLFKTHWPEYTGKIYLNTENKEYFHEGLNIISIKNKQTDNFWSQCLKKAMEYIEEDNLLYMQEDYFLHSSVNTSLLESYFKLFRVNDLDCLHLTDQCTNGPFRKNTSIPGIWEIKEGAPYRLSTQAAFWKKDSLVKIIRHWESGWQFEHYGTKRSNDLLYKVSCVNQDKIIRGINEILPYVFTGVIKGKWNYEIEPIFKQHNININFENRGFYVKPCGNTIKRKSNTLLKLIMQNIHNRIFEYLSRKVQ